MSSTVLPQQYRTSSSEVGSFHHEGPAPLYFPPSGAYLSRSVGRSGGWNSRTLQAPGDYTFSQSRNTFQAVQWEPARPMAAPTLSRSTPRKA